MNFEFEYSYTPAPTYGDGLMEADDTQDAEYQALNFVRDTHDGATNIVISDIKILN